jgi:hypothetical protein
MDPLSISASAAGLLTLAIQIFNYADTIKNAPKERAAFLSNMKMLEPLLKRLESHTTSTSPWASSKEQISDYLVLLEKDLRDIEKELRPPGGFQRLTDRMLWVINKPKFQEKMGDIGQHIQQIKFYVGEDHYDTSVNTNTIVRELSDDTKEGLTQMHDISTATKDSNIRVQSIQSTTEETLLAVHENKADVKETIALMKRLQLRDREKKVQEDAAERKGIAEWLSPYNFLAKQKDLKDSSYPLGQWLLEHEVFKAWFGGRPWQLRLYGDAGAGKVCCFFFFNIQENERTMNSTIS